MKHVIAHSRRAEAAAHAAPPLGSRVIHKLGLIHAAGAQPTEAELRALRALDDALRIYELATPEGDAPHCEACAQNYQMGMARASRSPAK